MQNIKVPGVAWVGLIMAVVGWLQGDWFAGEMWVPGVVIVLTAAAKLLQMYALQPEQLPRSAEDGKAHHALTFFWG